MDKNKDLDEEMLVDEDGVTSIIIGKDGEQQYLDEDTEYIEEEQILVTDSAVSDSDDAKDQVSYKVLYRKSWEHMDEFIGRY